MRSHLHAHVAYIDRDACVVIRKHAKDAHCARGLADPVRGSRFGGPRGVPHFRLRLAEVLSSVRASDLVRVILCCLYSKAQRFGTHDRVLVQAPVNPRSRSKRQASRGLGVTARAEDSHGEVHLQRACQCHPTRAGAISK